MPMGRRNSDSQRHDHPLPQSAVVMIDSAEVSRHCDVGGQSDAQNDGDFPRLSIENVRQEYKSLLQRFGGITVGSPEKDVLYGKPRYDYSGGSASKRAVKSGRGRLKDDYLKVLDRAPHTRSPEERHWEQDTSLQHSPDFKNVQLMRYNKLRFHSAGSSPQKIVNNVERTKTRQTPSASKNNNNRNTKNQNMKIKTREEWDSSITNLVQKGKIENRTTPKNQILSAYMNDHPSAHHVAQNIKYQAQETEILESDPSSTCEKRKKEKDIEVMNMWGSEFEYMARKSPSQYDQVNVFTEFTEEEKGGEKEKVAKDESEKRRDREKEREREREREKLKRLCGLECGSEVRKSSVSSLKGVESPTPRSLSLSHSRSPSVFISVCASRSRSGSYNSELRSSTYTLGGNTYALSGRRKDSKRDYSRPASACVPSTTSFSTSFPTLQSQSHLADRSDVCSDLKNVPVSVAASVPPPNDYRRASRCELVTVSRVIRLYNVEQEQVQPNEQNDDSNNENCTDDSSGDDVDQSTSQLFKTQHQHHRNGRRHSDCSNKYSNNNNNNKNNNDDYDNYDNDNHNRRRESKTKSDNMSKSKSKSKKSSKEIPPVGESTCCYTPRQSECRSFYTAHAKLHCWVLAQRKTLLIRAELPDSFPVIEVEAEVSVRDLALARGLDVDCLLIDPELEKIAREIIDQAELTIESTEGSHSPHSAHSTMHSSDTARGPNVKHETKTNLVLHLHRLRVTDDSRSEVGEDGLGGDRGNDFGEGEGGTGGRGDGEGDVEVKGSVGDGEREGGSEAERGGEKDKGGESGKGRGKYVKHNSTADAFVKILERAAAANYSNLSKVRGNSLALTLLGCPSSDINVNAYLCGQVEPLIKVELLREWPVPVTYTTPCRPFALRGPVDRYHSTPKPRDTGVGSIHPVESANRPSSTNTNNCSSTRNIASHPTSLGCSSQSFSSSMHPAPFSPHSSSTSTSNSRSTSSSSSSVSSPRPEVTPHTPPYVHTDSMRDKERDVLFPPLLTAPTSHTKAILHKPTNTTIKSMISIATSSFDKAIISIRFLEDSKDNQLNRVAVLAGTTVSLSTGLPSIMQADMDPELTLEFFENLLKGLSVEHDSNTKVNSCIIEMRK